MNINGVFVSDFDGTFYDHRFGFDPLALEGMELLKERGILRVIATGRSNFFKHKEIDVQAFSDYVIFSSGSVILNSATGELLQKACLTGAQVAGICRILKQELSLNFMVQNVWPHNHTFAYWPQNSQIADFTRRVALYDKAAEFITEIPQIDATEIITIINPERRIEVVGLLQRSFPELSIITATSPLDHSSIWLEIFPKDVSKSKACMRLLDILQCSHVPTAAIGNDYNDMDMLQWADYGFVVSNAPQEVWGAFDVVAKVGEGGVREAAINFMQRIKKNE